MTSAERGEEQFQNKGRKGGCMNLVLISGKGVKNPENVSDVICERPVTILLDLYQYQELNFQMDSLVKSADFH